MNFSSLLKPLNTKEEKTVTSYHLIDNREALQALIKEAIVAKDVCIDLETTGLDPLAAEIVGMGMGWKEGEAAYIPFNGSIPKDFIINEIRTFFANKNVTIFGHNIKYDGHVLCNEGISLPPLSFDTMVASYLLNSASNRHNLDALSLEFFDKTKTPITHLMGEKKKIPMLDLPIEKVKEYCCEDVDYTIRLRNLFYTKLHDRKMERVFYQIELPLIPILANMERKGIFVDVEKLNVLSVEFEGKLKQLQEKIFSHAGVEFNINSPKQLSEILYETLKLPKKKGRKTSQYATSADLLKQLEPHHPIISFIIAYRTLEKLRSTYIDALPQKVNPKTKRIHCSFNQSVTATGRLSSNNPNLQNIPVRGEEGKRIRSAFQPQKKGWSFLSADYSQIELRILAHLSEDPHLISSFCSGGDVHLDTAAKVFKVAREEVTKQMRSKAKAVNFGVLYGQGPFGLSQELGISLAEAKQFIKDYFATYPRVKEYIEEEREKAEKQGYVETIMGRQRLLPELKSNNHMVKQAGMRLAVNAPIQGGQADIIKMAMIQMDQLIEKKGWDAPLILQIHDELIFECPDPLLSSFEEELRPIMEGVVSLKVPLKVDISIGKNWGEC